MLSFLFALSIAAPVKDTTCDLCHTAVKIVREAVASGFTDEQVKTALQQSCPTLPSALVPLCQKALENIDAILKDVHAGKDDQYICSTYGFCGNAVVKAARQPDLGNAGCDVCHGIVGLIESLLKEQATQEIIIEQIDKLCDTMKDPLKSLCDQLVAHYIPTIINWIEQGIEKAQICEKLGFCSTSVSAAIRQPNGMTCTVCTTIVQAIEKAMVSTKVESEIIALVEKLCAKIPAPYSTLCDSLVEQYVPKIMEWLEQGLEHLEICQKIGLCSAEEIKIRQNANSITCDLCTGLVKAIEEAMVSTTVESEIIALVEKLCNKAPAPWSTLCDSLVQQYVPTIMEWLEQGLEHLEICQKIGLCSKTVARLPQQANGITCDVCKDFFKWAGDEIEKYTVPFLWKLVSEKCPAVPYLKYFCQIINEQNIETFVNLLISAVPPQEACEFIKIC